MQSLKDINGTVLANACGPCIGQWRRAKDVATVPNTIVTSYNRNFKGRNDGNRTTLSFIGSPEIVTAMAFAGRLSFNPLTDSIDGPNGPVKFTPPEAPELPDNGFVFAEGGFVAPAADGSGVEVNVSLSSDRLQLLEPFPAWDGHDYVELPLLLKAKGKCTTDHISPAGKWLKYRGHLDNISNNMFTGAINAFTDATGTTKNLDTGETGEVQTVARHYKAAGKRWVVVGDSNYGEGSSREHAAMSPRLLGAAAVIVRSFARIAETNLKKQGVLPLTFSDAADYDKLQQDDRVSLLGLADLAPGKPVDVVLSHADGTEHSFAVKHTLSAEQIDWFRAGSALNCIAARNQ